jgi:acyl-CoA synthetase (AMP-forming)/AMP-acid ligase II
LAYQLLTTHNLKDGDRALLVFFPGLDFTVTLIACFKAGIIAIPVFPPDPRKLKKDLHHFINIQTNSNSQVVLTNSQYSFVKKVENFKTIFSSEQQKWPSSLTWIQVDEIIRKGKKNSPSSVIPLQSLTTNTENIFSHNEKNEKTETKTEKIAFLQYTSGSTSDPKGVIITHGNLAHNLTIIIDELKANTSTVNVSWLPQYHDMGLIGENRFVFF